MSQDRQSRIVRFGFAIGALLLVMGGPISGYFLTRIFLEAKASATWPAVNGIIARVQVGETSAGQFFPDVAYTYTVGTVVFTGTRIRTSDGEYAIRDGAVQAMQELTVGAPITVYYNPSNPRQSVIRNGAGWQEYVLLLVPVAMFAIGIWSVRRLWRTRRPIE